MFIPSSKIGPWAAELIQACQPDVEERLQRGALYKNLYLTGSEDGNPAIYPKTYAHIAMLSALYFSPLELRYDIKFHGGGNLTKRAMGRAAAIELHQMMGEAATYDRVRDATKWSLVKGRCFLKMLWEDQGFAPYLVQPEMMGVLRPDIVELNRQPAFVHTSYYTPDQFASAFRQMPNLPEIMKKIARKANIGKEDNTRPDRNNALKQIILGGLNPYQQASSTPANAGSRGIVDWLAAPSSTFNAKIMAQLIKLDELWVWDSVSDDWATFQLVGDVLITGEDQIRNAFSSMFDPDNSDRRLPESFREDNPLNGMHPFISFCPNELDGYFWGRSELCNVGVLQMSINSRLDGINRLLRRQERPPRLVSGTTAINRDKYSAMDMPGGFFNDPSPNAKAVDLYPKFIDLVFVMLDCATGAPTFGAQR